MNYKKISLVVAFVALLPIVTYAQAFVPLVGIPQLSGTPNLGSYINALYALSISIAALLAVIKIIIAGVKWMLSDVVTSKQEAKSDIQGALLGLLIVISAVLVLGQINPQLISTSLILSPVSAPPATSGGGSGASGSGTLNTPLPAPSAALPIDTRYLACVNTTPNTRRSTWDCSAQRTECSAIGGQIQTNFIEGKQSIRCVLGRNNTQTCSSTGVGRGGTGTINCQPILDSCRGPGQIITQITPKKVNCYTPITPN
jgi:hypothetical protein